VDNKSYKWFVPAPFRSDGASIPQTFKTFVGGNWDGPSSLHCKDWIHRNGGASSAYIYIATADIRSMIYLFPFRRSTCALNVQKSSSLHQFLTLGPRFAVIGNFACWRLLVVDVQRNQIADLHSIVIAVAVDLARERWRRQGQQINRGNDGVTHLLSFRWVEHSTVHAFVHLCGLMTVICGASFLSFGLQYLTP
jgi:hypothetical protein